MNQHLMSSALSRVMATPPSRIRVPGSGTGRVRATAIALGTALAIALTPAGAATLAGHGSAAAPAAQHPPYPNVTGHYGVMSLIDSPTFPAAICFWHSGQHPSLYKINVRRPIMFASPRVSGSTSQTVGWRYQIEYSTDESHWSVIASSAIYTSTARRGREAFWPGHTFTFNTRPTNGYYRIKIRLFWYWPDATTIDGNGIAYPQFYWVQEPFEQYLPNDCPQPLV